MRCGMKEIVVAALLIAGPGLTAGDYQAPVGQAQEPDVVYVGTPYDVVSRMLRMAQLRKADVVYDLGCGDGRTLVLAARKFGCRGRGFDIDPERVSAARSNVERNGVGDLVEIVEADMFTVDIGDADVLFLYLLPDLNLRLLPKFESLRPGSRLVFHDYGLKGVLEDESVQIISNEDNASHTIFLYTTPLRFAKD